MVVVGADVDLSVAAPFGCSVQTGAGTVMNVLELDERSSLVVFGAGGVGLPAVMAARALGVSTIIVVDPVPAAGSSPLSSAPPSRSTRESTTSSKPCATTRAAGRQARSRRRRSSTCSLQALDCLFARGYLRRARRRHGGAPLGHGAAATPRRTSPTSSGSRPRLATGTPSSTTPVRSRRSPIRI